HEPRHAGDHRGRGAAEPAPRLLRQRRPRLDRRAADHHRPRAARRGRARRGGTKIPRARGAGLPPRAHRARPAGAAGAAHPARAGGHDRPPAARAGYRAMILLNPGPVNVSPRVTAALARGDLCHREPEYGDLQASIRSRLLRAFAPGGGFTAVLITGSGTAALEAAVTSVLSARGRLVVVSNGVYGERIAAMAAAARLPHTVVEGAWTEPPDLAAVERALRAPDVEAVAVVHHETTTGLLNPVAELGRLARAHGKLVLVDSVSGLAGDALDLEAADLIVGTGGKCIQA